MRLLFCGDIVGRSGREAIEKHIPRLRKDLGLDFVVVNGENAAGGFGITAKICEDLFKVGVDVITGGNHSWDQRAIMTFIDAEPKLLRPVNFPSGTPGRGAQVYTTAKGKKVLVINVMGRLFMDPLDDPFQAVSQVLERFQMGKAVDLILVDIHAEATSEKMAMGHHLDGKASLVVGTHSHVPTADAHILPKGTAYQSDAGMCGDYNSVIGMEITAPLLRFTRKLPTERLSPATGEGTVNGVFLESDDATGLARRIEPLRLGPHLLQHIPQV